MTTQAQVPSLTVLEYIPYLDDNGKLPEKLQGKIGVYAIFDREKKLQLVNYSRDIYISLKQHLVRQPQSCYWVKVETIERPNRSRLETIQEVWINENAEIPVGNGSDQALWNQPIDAKPDMTDQERLSYEQSDDLARTKLLKTIARRVEARIVEELKSRGVSTEIRFNPKQKEKGLLDLK